MTDRGLGAVPKLDGAASPPSRIFGAPVGKALFHTRSFTGCPQGGGRVSRLDDLKAARDVMWASIEDTPASQRAPLMNQWRALEATIAELEAKSEKAGDPLDEIAARRAARGGSTARARRAEGAS